MTRKSEVVLTKHIFTEKRSKAAYKNSNHYFSLLNYKSCRMLKSRCLFCCPLQKYMYKVGYKCVNSLLFLYTVSTNKHIKIKVTAGNSNSYHIYLGLIKEYNMISCIRISNMILYRGYMILTVLHCSICTWWTSLNSITLTIVVLFHKA
jgi:hypothetical protein